jgi:hypothetical protein
VRHGELVHGLFSIFNMRQQFESVGQQRADHSGSFVV